MAGVDEAVLLKSTLEINSKPYAVKLTASEIYWESISSRTTVGPYSEPLVKSTVPPAGGEPAVVVVESVCAPDAPSVVEPLPATHLSLSESSHTLPCMCLCKRRKTENQTVKLSEVIAVRLETKHHAQGASDGKFHNLEMLALQATTFSVFVVQRLKKHRWRPRKVSFCSLDTSVIQQWVEKISDMIAKPDAGRPRYLLVFINPVSGRKKAASIYNHKVAPLLDLAGISSDVIVTQRANHARDTLLEYDFSKVDGVVSVGGDGMLSECLHGLLTRTLRDAGCADHPSPGQTPPQPRMRIGVIPAGSTDTVTYSSTGISDPVTATLHIILGDDVAIDVATVHHGPQFLRYNVSMFGYGYYGDLLADSDQNRWMGPSRYKWSGFKKVLSNRAYEGEISFIPNKERDNHPKDGSRCRPGCQVCNTVHNGNGTDAAVTEPEVQRIKGRFLAINNFIMSCRCELSPEGAAPSAHLGDGCSDLILVHSCSRIDYARHLYRTTDRRADQFALPFIQVFRVREFQFRPLVEEIDDKPIDSDSRTESQQRLKTRSEHNSVWNCDGEVVDEPSVDFRVHRQVVRLFARGVEDDVSRGEEGCMSCLHGAA